MTPVALELRQVVDEQDAVQMVDLVLQAGREQPVRFDLVRLALKIEILDLHLRGAFDVIVEFRNRKTSFFVDRLLVAGGDDLRIDEDLRRSSARPSWRCRW